MKKIKDKKGFALITALILSLLAMGLIAILTHLIMTGISMSASFKSYTSALDAAKGGMEYFIQDISDNIYHKGVPSDTSVICKMQQDTSNWATSCRGYLKAENMINSTQDLYSHSSISDIVNHYDSKTTFGNYNVYIKLIDAHGTNNNRWYYTFDVVAENKNNKTGEAWITVLIKTD